MIAANRAAAVLPARKGTNGNQRRSLRANCLIDGLRATDGIRDAILAAYAEVERQAETA